MGGPHAQPPDRCIAGPGAILFDAPAKRGDVLGKVERVPHMMQELKAANVEVVVIVGDPAAAIGGATQLASGSGDRR